MRYLLARNTQRFTKRCEFVLERLVLASKGMPNIGRIMLYSIVGGERIKSDDGYLEKISSLDIIAEKLGNKKGFDMSATMPVPASPTRYALQMFLGDLQPEGFGDEQVHPLLPVSKTEDHAGAGLEAHPVHRAFVIHNKPGDIEPKLKLKNATEGSLVQTILDVPVEVIEKASPNNDQKLRISTECATLALELAREKPPDRQRIAKLWAKSKISDLTPIFLKCSDRVDMGTEQIPAHVRDSIAALLATNIPDTLPDFEVFVKANREKAVNSVKVMLHRATDELQNQQLTLQLPSINPFTARSRLRSMLFQVETSILTTTEGDAMWLYTWLEKRGSGPLNGDVAIKDTSIGGRKSIPPFSDLRTKSFELGASLDSHVRASRLGFYSSCGLGAGATGLLFATGVDPIITLSLFALIFEVSRRKFVSQTRDLVVSYRQSLVDLGLKCLQDVNKIFEGLLEVNKESDLRDYSNKKEELELLKKEVKEARELLLKMAPSLKAKFPQW
ncbi:hypothetical protein TWF281_005439 [Arthrobotrys megalospora]